MHFSIPSTKEFYNKNNGSSYMAYSIHINGAFHCYLRFKQLHSLNEQLKRSLSTLSLPPFPPKLLLPLTPNQLEQRRNKLERYIQLIGQDPVISKSDLLRTFLLKAQQETSMLESQEVSFDVYLMNGYCISFNIYITDCSSKILEAACLAIDIPKEMIYYFGLYVMRTEENGGVVLTRRLDDFEAPYITKQYMEDCKIVIRKNYWDPCYDSELMANRISLNLLYIQTVSDVERGWILTTTNDRETLSSLQARGNKKNYLDIAKNLPLYGYLHFNHAIVDYPEPKTMSSIAIGNREICILATTPTCGRLQETKFKVTRMRCWRVSTILNDDQIGVSTITTNENNHNYTFELSFEYLMAKNCLKWITICSDQAMLLSVSLQSIVDELLKQKNGIDANVQVHKNNTKLSYIRRDDSIADIIENSHQPLVVNRTNSTSKIENISAINGRKRDAKFSTAVSFSKDNESVRNDAFEIIGDEDL